MKRQRPPYAKRSLTSLVAVMAVVLVVACAVLGYEVYHLHNEVNGLHNQVNALYGALLKSGQAK